MELELKYNCRGGERGGPKLTLSSQEFDSRNQDRKAGQVGMAGG